MTSTTAVDSGGQAGEVTFDEFVAARSRALLRTAYLLTHDHALAEDLLQTSLAKLWLAWSRVDEPDAYVRKVMVTTYASWWRRKWRGETPTAELTDLPASDVYDEADRRDAVRAALRSLPPRQRAVVVLRFHEDMSEAQVAAALGISVGTVKSQTAKALVKLRTDAALTGYGSAASPGSE